MAAVAYTDLAAGVGPIEAKTILRTALRSPVSDLLGLLDAAHAGSTPSDATSLSLRTRSRPFPPSPSTTPAPLMR